MSDYSIVPNAALTATADAIRTKSGSQATIEFDHNTGFADAIDDIPTGGGEMEVVISDSGAVAQSLDANVIYHFTGELTALTISLTAPASGIVAHYHFDFDCGNTAPTVTIPNSVTMPANQSFDTNKHYEVDILNNYGAVLSW